MTENAENASWHFNIGKEFEEAFYLLIGQYNPPVNQWTTPLERPSYYCAGLACEHYLKGYLRLKGIKFPTNHEGHDLNKLILLGGDRLIVSLGLNEVDLKQISLLNERYYVHESYGKDDLRYGSVMGIRTSPHPDAFNQILKKIAEKLSFEIYLGR